MIAKNTTEIYFNEKILFISLNSAALKHELSYNKEELIKRINNFCGYQLIQQLVIR